jgi:heme exporter protein A
VAAVNAPVPPVLRLESLGKTFGPRSVLRQVSFEAAGGEVIAVTGPNGSGKSTLLKIIAGLLRPTRGTVNLTLGGRRVVDTAARRRAVGYAGPDLAFYPELTGRENLQFFAAARGLSWDANAAERRLTDLGLAAGRGGDPVGAYSSGMRQRLRLAFALLSDPAVLLLDEPSLALDREGVAAVAGVVALQKAAGRLTLLATNDAREAALGGRVLALGG